MHYVYANTSYGKPVIEEQQQLDDLLKNSFSLRPHGVQAAGIDSCVKQYTSYDTILLHHPEERTVDGVLWFANTFILTGPKERVEWMVKELHRMYSGLGYLLNSAVSIPPTTADTPSLSRP